MQTIRSLQVIGKMDRGGAETLIMNLMRNVSPQDVRFDFLVHTAEHADYDDEIISRGGRIWRLPQYNVFNSIGYRKACNEFFEAHAREYDLVHGHIGSCAGIYVPIARHHGLHTVVHSHNVTSRNAKGLAYRALARTVVDKADYYLACSKHAGLDRFGRKVVEGERFEVFLNGIDSQVFGFDPTQRSKTRFELGVGNRTVIGHVGRFVDQKNHAFLIDVFAHLLVDNPDAVLALVGRGPLEESVQKQAKRLGIIRNVLFLGVRDDIPCLLSAFDAFLFPSKWEGLGISLVEAQASGLPCLVSDAIEPEAVILDSTVQMSLSAGVEAWARELGDSFLQTPTVTRHYAAERVKRAGFDIRDSARHLIEVYGRVHQC